LKPPGTKRLKPKHDEPPSNFAFTFNLRRYIMLRVEASYPKYTRIKELIESIEAFKLVVSYLATVVGRCRLTSSNPRWNRLGLNA